MDLIEPPPSRSSLRGLDAVNLFLAGALSGFGPYVAVFLAEQKWTEQNIGFVLTAGGFAGLLSCYPAGNCSTPSDRKRPGRAGGYNRCGSALIIAIRPSLPLDLAALVLQAITGGVPGLAVAAISLGLVVPRRAWQRLATQPALRLDGRGNCGGLMGVIGYILSYRAIFFAAAALSSCRCLPLSAASSFRTLWSGLGAPGYRAERRSTALEPLEEW